MTWLKKESVNMYEDFPYVVLEFFKSKIKITKFNSFYGLCRHMQCRNDVGYVTLGLESTTISTLQPVELEFIYTACTVLGTSNTFLDSSVGYFIFI